MINNFGIIISAIELHFPAINKFFTNSLNEKFNNFVKIYQNFYTL